MLFVEIISTILFYITLPFYFLERVLHGKSGGWKLKFGFCKNITDSQKAIMVHACSVGEVTAIEDLVKKIKQKFPGNQVVVTTSTLTGQAVAQKKLGEIADYITFFPFDIPSCVERFLKKINPEVVLIAETEIWPCFANRCKKHNIPLYIVNGRISDKSYNMYKFASLFFKKVFRSYTSIYTQSAEDTEKFISIGVNPNNVEFMGNLKFGVTKANTNIDIGKNEYKVILAGSTHKPENPIVIETYAKLKKDFSDLKLLIAPRHLERVKEIEILCKNYNLKYGLRSSNDKFSQDIDVIILDTLGELKNMYAVADIAFIGGSFNKTGGHNPLEASIWNIPVLTGPSIFNFKDIYGILTKSGAAKIVKTSMELYDSLTKLIKDNTEYQNMKTASNKVFDEQKGALDFVIQKLKSKIST